MLKRLLTFSFLLLSLAGERRGGKRCLEYYLKAVKAGEDEGGTKRSPAGMLISAGFIIPGRIIGRSLLSDFRPYIFSGGDYRIATA